VPRLGAEMSELGIVPDGAVMVAGEHIRWVGRSRDLPAVEVGEHCRILDGKGLDLVALPGLVDPHTHPVFAGTRVDEYELRSRGTTYAEIAAGGGGIRASVRQLRAATLGQLVERTKSYFNMFLAHGTTTIEAKSGYGLCLEAEIKSLQALAELQGLSDLEVIPTFLGAHDVPDEYRQAREEYLRLVIDEMIPLVARDGLAKFCDVYCDEGYFTVEEARAVLQAAREAGLRLRIHAEQLTRSGGAQLAAELGARSADHLEWIDDSDIEAMKRAGTVAILLPAPAFNLGGCRYAPARKLISSGIPVALATDFNPGSSYTLNMQLVMALACTQMKMIPAEAVTAATLNAAYSLGLADRIGSLEEGKQADIALMAVRDYREIPYFFGVNHCVAVIKRGTIVLNRLENP